MSDSIYAGNACDIFETIDDIDGAPQNLTDMSSCLFTMKRSVYDDEILLQKSLDDGITITGIATGDIRIRIDTGDTDGMYGPYVYDVEAVIDGKEYTTLKDILILKLKVTP